MMSVERFCYVLAALAFAYTALSALGNVPSGHYATALALGLAIAAVGKALRP